MIVSSSDKKRNTAVKKYENSKVFLWRNSPNSPSTVYSSSITWNTFHLTPPVVDWYSWIFGSKVVFQSISSSLR